MSLQRQHRYVSPEEYLAVEREAEDRNEYVDGAVREVGESGYKHSVIVANTAVGLANQLKGAPAWPSSPL